MATTTDIKKQAKILGLTDVKIEKLLKRFFEIVRLFEPSFKYERRGKKYIAYVCGEPIGGYEIGHRNCEYYAETNSQVFEKLWLEYGYLTSVDPIYPLIATN